MFILRSEASGTYTAEWRIVERGLGEDSVLGLRIFFLHLESLGYPGNFLERYISGLCFRITVAYELKFG